MTWSSRGCSSDEGDVVKRGLRGFAVTATVLMTSLAISGLAHSGGDGARLKLDGYSALWPQRWSFFVGLDAGLLNGYRFTPGDARMTPVDVFEQRPSMWGLDRGSYKVTSEVREIASRVPDHYWQSCARPDPADCGSVLDTALAFELKPFAREPELCGLLAVTVYRVDVPTTRELPKPSDQDHRFAVVNVACPG